MNRIKSLFLLLLFLAGISLNAQVKATKTVRQFFDLILNEPRSLQAINEPIYLAFFSVTGSFKDKTAKLAQVETYQLIFED